MTIKVGVISHSQKFIDLIHILADQSVQLIAKHVDYYHAPEAAKNLQNNGVGVIIARERTADYIKSSVPLTVVDCKFQPIDILTTISMVPPEGYPWAMIREESRIGRSLAIVDLVEKIWGHKLETIFFSDFKNLENQLQTAIAKGIRGIIGGKLVTEMANQFGLKSYEFAITQETARSAVEKAISIAEAQHERQNHLSCLTAVLNSSGESLILNNKQDEILALSSQAENLTGLKPKEKISQIFPVFAIEKHRNRLKTGQSVKDQTFTKPNTTHNMLYSLIPVMNRESELNGYIVRLNQSNDFKQNRKQNNPYHNLSTEYSLDDIIGKSVAMTKAKAQAREFAKNNLNVLLTGETGTGKELFAHSIHHASERCKGPFVAINCAALPPSILESELFGYDEGAFTGAKKGGKKGLFELANEGTIFLDELGELPLDIQARLLRVLQSREIMRLGGTQQIRINVRIISATNKDLEEAVQAGTFRRDLYYRLNTLILPIPPLRERREDIPTLLSFFMNKLNLTQSRLDNVNQYINYLLEKIEDYNWPGNVRELRNLIERCTVEYDLLQNGIMKPDELFPYYQIKTNYSQNIETKSTGSLNSMKVEAIYSAGERANWNRKKMAKILGISLSTLWREMKKHNILP